MCWREREGHAEGPGQERWDCASLMDSAGPRKRSCTWAGAIPAQKQTGQRMYQKQVWGEGLGSICVKFSTTRQDVLTAQKVSISQAASKYTWPAGRRSSNAAFLRPHLEFCIQVWCPQHNKDMELLEKIQSTGLITGLKSLCFEGRLRRSTLFRLEK